MKFFFRLLVIFNNTALNARINYNNCIVQLWVGFTMFVKLGASIQLPTAALAEYVSAIRFTDHVFCKERDYG